MRYKITGVFLLFIFGINLYSIISRIVQNKTSDSLYYYAMVLAALVAGVYFLFFKKKRA